jgi:anti-anti-sigma regulatory factor
MLADPPRGPGQVICDPASDDGALRITGIGGQGALAVAGEIDEDNYPALVDALGRLTDGVREIHINLAGVQYCDLAGLRAIMRLAGRAGNHDHENTRLVLHEVPGYLVAVLQILGWDTTPGLTIEKPGQHPAGQALPIPGSLDWSSTAS